MILYRKCKASMEKAQYDDGQGTEKATVNPADW